MKLHRSLIRALLIDRTGALLKHEPAQIAPDRPLIEYGLDRGVVANLLADLEVLLAVPLAPPRDGAHLTLDALAAYVVAAAEAGADAPPGATEADEPIAVVGMACRFPQAPDPGAYWQLLCEGRCARGEIPPNRWDAETLYHPDPRNPGTAHSRFGYFLPEVDRFEPGFFGISPREAQLMDPQQRLMLELSWEALEDAGQVIDGLRGSRTGVFFGLIWNDYATLSHRVGFTAIAQHTVTGAHYSLLSNRVSYAFGFQGPSLSFDIACATGLVATHLACQSLRSGESTLALAGGVNLMIAPDSYLVVAKMGTLAPDGLCKVFDARADGFGRGEGGGVVVLKTLSRALRDGDRIYCTIRGSATNHNGNGERLTLPNADAQRAVLLEALRRARVEPEQVVYVEAHGTGTRAGDPAEARALGSALGAARPADRPLWIGSAKTNLGHLEGASGLVGLIKAALSLYHRTIPPSLHFEVPNPQIAFDAWNVRVADHLIPLPPQDAPLVMGVNAFGLGGANCHVVLAEHRPGDAAAPSHLGDDPELITLSAHSAEALKEMATDLGDFLRQHPEIHLRDIAFTRNARRAHLAHRLAIVAGTHEEAASRLARASASVSAGAATLGPRPRAPQPAVVFVFSGQGGHWAGMGAGLLAGEPVFREAMEACAQALAPHLGASLLDELRSDAGDARWERPSLIQPLLFALQVALARLLASWGIVPAATIGHSLGEIAAAYVAGALSLAEAAAVVHHRSRLSEQCARRDGAMAVVDLTPAEAEQALVPFAGELGVAAVNGPRMTVLSGDADALQALCEQHERRGGFHRRVDTNYAWHSHHVEPAALPLRAALTGLAPAATTRAFYSTVVGRALGGAELDAEYWALNLRRPVMFADAVAAAMSAGHERFLEIGPHPLLVAGIERLAGSLARPVVAVPTLRRNEPERRSLLEGVGALYRSGMSVDWPGLYPGGGRVVSLPGYRWQRRRYWADGLVEAARIGAADGAGVHALVAPAPGPAAAPANAECAISLIDTPAAVHAALRREVVELLLLPGDTEIDQAPLIDLGLDSTSALRLQARCAQLFDWSPAITALLRGASTCALAEEAWNALSRRRTAAAAERAAEPRAQVQAPAASGDIDAWISQLSDAAVDRELLALLEPEIAE